MCIEWLSVITHQLMKAQKFKKKKKSFRMGPDLPWKTLATENTQELKRGTPAQFSNYNHFNYKETFFLVSWLWFPHSPNNLVISQRVSIKLITMSNINFFKGPIQGLMKLLVNHIDRQCSLWVRCSDTVGVLYGKSHRFITWLCQLTALIKMY